MEIHLLQPHLVVLVRKPCSAQNRKNTHQTTAAVPFTMKLVHILASVTLYSMGVFSQSDDAAKAVATINQARQAHGLQPLTWHPDLATYAQYWADRMGSGQEPFHHASGVLRPSQGETLYQEQSMQCDPAYDTPLQSAVKDWLGQAPLYTGQAISTGQEPWLHFCEDALSCRMDI